MPNNDFYENNKIALIEELGSGIMSANKILNEIINNCDDDETEPKPSDDKLLIALGHKLGYLTAVFDQYYVFMNGISSKEEKKIGFKSMFGKKAND